MNDVEKQKVLEFVRNIQRIKDDHNENRIPINYGTICGLVIEGCKLVKELNISDLKLRDATKEEIDSVNRYVEQISVPEGVNFYDVLEKSRTHC